MADPVPLQRIAGHGTVRRPDTNESVGKFGYQLSVFQMAGVTEKPGSPTDNTPNLKWIDGRIDGLIETLIQVPLTLTLEDGRCFALTVNDVAGNFKAEIDLSKLPRNPENYEFIVDIPAGTGFQPFKGIFRNVNVILGANGTGKSKLLGHLRDQAGKLNFPENIIYVEGGRVVVPPDAVKFNRNTFQQYETLAIARQTHLSKRRGFLRDRAGEAFLLLKKMGDESKAEHSDKIEEWIKNGQVGEVPRQRTPPLEELFELFHQVFPEIRMEMLPDTLEIRCTKNDKKYSPSSLSDGEKQALCLLADIALLADEFSLIIVDEPELNLHPHLAEDLWNAIELRYPNCLFIYATHNIAFSLRPQVPAVFVLGRIDRPSVAISSPLELDASELRPFLGSIPAILASEQCLIVEGSEKSFDSVFYRWVVGQPSLVIEPIGGASNVAHAAKGAGVWNRIAPSQKIGGVIDRDFKSDDELGKIVSDRLVVLDFHEAESYLCHPKIIRAIAMAIGTSDSIPSEDELSTIILECAKNSIHYVVTQRVFRRLPIQLRPSLDRSEARNHSNSSTLLERIKTVCKEEKDKAVSNFDEATVVAIFQSELENCKSLVDTANIDEVLRVFEGKQMLRKLYGYASCPNPEAVARGASRHLNDLNSYPHLANLRKILRTTLSL